MEGERGWNNWYSFKQTFIKMDAMSKVSLLSCCIFKSFFVFYLSSRPCFTEVTKIPLYMKLFKLLFAWPLLIKNLDFFKNWMFDVWSTTVQFFQAGVSQKSFDVHGSEERISDKDLAFLSPPFHLISHCWEGGREKLLASDPIYSPRGWHHAENNFNLLPPQWE